MRSQIPTEIDFLDHATGGGQLNFGLHAILGPSPSAKTTLGVMIAAEGAKSQHARAVRGDTAGQWVLISPVQSKDDLLRLALSHIAKIPRDTIDSLQFSQVRQSRGYETERALTLAAPDGTILSEQERIDEALGIYGGHLSIFAFPNRIAFGKGRKPIDCVQSTIDLLKQRGPVAGIVIDDVGQLIRSWMDHVGKPMRQQSWFMRDFLAGLSWTALYNQCPVWVMHQLRGAVNKYSPATPQHHSDAAECKPFGKGLDVAVCLGTMNRETGQMLLNCTKLPAELGKPPDPTIIKFDSLFASVVSVPGARLTTDRWVIQGDTSLVICGDHSRELVRERVQRARQEAIAAQEVLEAAVELEKHSEVTPSLKLPVE
jgi:hypothetical protein